MSYTKQQVIDTLRAKAKEYATLSLIYSQASDMLENGDITPEQKKKIAQRPLPSTIYRMGG